MEHHKKKTLVFLTGFMGSGKSTLGPILANTIGFQFFDLDAVIEKKTKKRINEIFASEGEEKFRALERETLAQFLNEPTTIISLGGGTVTNNETLQLVKEHGILVYLKSDIEHIYHRLRTKSDRPLLRDDNGNLLDGNELKEKISSLITKREKFYNQADMIISTDNKWVGNSIDELAKKLKRYVE